MGLFDDLKRALVGESKTAKPRKRKRKPIKKKDVMASRKSIVAVATEMTSSGEIRIEDILSGVDDEMIE